MKASGKAFLCLLVVMLVVMTLFFMMSTFKLQTTLTHLVQSQLTVLAESVADPLEGAIDLGLSLSELRNAESLIKGPRIMTYRSRLLISSILLARFYFQQCLTG